MTSFRLWYGTREVLWRIIWTSFGDERLEKKRGLTKETKEE